MTILKINNQCQICAYSKRLEPPHNFVNGTLYDLVYRISAGNLFSTQRVGLRRWGKLQSPIYLGGVSTDRWPTLVDAYRKLKFNFTSQFEDYRALDCAWPFGHASKKAKNFFALVMRLVTWRMCTVDLLS